MEKTLDELLKPHQKRLDWHNQNRIYIDKADVLKLLQQVREATIEECKEIADKYYFQNSRNIIRDINDIPTDRIKTTEKQ